MTSARAAGLAAMRRHMWRSAADELIRQEADKASPQPRPLIGEPPGPFVRDEYAAETPDP